MSEITVPVRKFLQLFDYLERLELDVNAIAAAVDLSRERITRLAEDEQLVGLAKIEAEEDEEA